jgi:hypothetical protein
MQIFAQQADRDIHKLLETKRTENLNKKITGYRIQLYYGLSESKAKTVRNKFIELFPDYSVRLFYSQPEWKVHVGNYRTKLEAERALKVIKPEFGNAFILKTSINIP